MLIKISPATKILVKIGISGLLIWLVFRTIDLRILVHNLVSSNKVYLVLAFIVFIISFVCGCFRWGVLINKFGDFSIRQVLQLSFIGFFYNVFIPGGVAGDVIKGVKTKSIGAGYSAASIVLDRIIGLIGFIIILFISLLWSKSIIPNKQVWVLLLLICIAAILFFIIMTLRRSYIYINHLIDKFSLHKLRKILTPFYDYSKDPKNVFISFSIGMLATFLNIIVIILLALSLDVHVSFLSHMTFVPAIIISSLLPISFRGAGIREWLFVFFYSSQGISAEKSLAISAIYFFLNMALALIGKIVESASTSKAIT